MIENEVFVIRDDNGPILYAPLIGFSARVNEACVDAVERKLEGKEDRPEDKAIIDYLGSFGLFDQVELPRRKELPPTEVTLFPSDGCNLRCVYCYAECGGANHLMPLDTGKAAIDRVIRNAREQNSDSFIVKFHGNGEPFTAFELVKELSAYARSRAEETGMSAYLIVVSNGFWNPEMLSWVIDEIDDIAISFDGIREVQDRQRPTVSGTGSFSVVDNTLRELSRQKKTFGIKVTVTAESVCSIVDTAEYIAASYPECEWVQFEPVWNVGRYANKDDGSSCYARFAEEFIRADNLFGDRIRLLYATANINKTCLCNCEVSSDQFIVTPQGAVTSCYEVYDAEDPRSAVFIYGRYDGKNGFVLDKDKIDALHRYTVNHIPYCRNCFCKYHCAGDCPAKLLLTDPVESFSGSSRCALTRAITKYRIAKQLS